MHARRRSTNPVVSRHADGGVDGATLSTAFMRLWTEWARHSLITVSTAADPALRLAAWRMKKSVGLLTGAGSCGCI